MKVLLLWLTINTCHTIQLKFLEYNNIKLNSAYKKYEGFTTSHRLENFTFKFYDISLIDALRNAAPISCCVFASRRRVIHSVTETDHCGLTLSPSCMPLRLFLCEKNAKRKKEDFWHSSVKIFTQLLAAECVSCVGHRTKDDRHSGAPLCGISLKEAFLNGIMISSSLLVPCSSCSFSLSRVLLLPLRIPQLLVIILFAEQTLTEVF